MGGGATIGSKTSRLSQCNKKYDVKHRSLAKIIFFAKIIVVADN